MKINIWKKIKDMTRPMRFNIRESFMSDGERLARRNVHSYSELSTRNLSYNFDEIDFSHKRNHVIYTCITGGYDNLIQPSCYNPDYDYICFTDNKDWIEKGIIGVWQIRSLFENKFSNALNNRWHKTHPRILFPEYDDSIYIDGNIDILTDSIFSQIERKKNPIVIPVHFARDCVYKEIATLGGSNKIKKEHLNAMKLFLKYGNFPKHYGLNENNLIYRKHNQKDVVAIMEEWWELILNVAPRDQLSLPYVLWTHNIKPSDIGITNIRLQPQNFSLYFGEEHK